MSKTLIVNRRSLLLSLLAACLSIAGLPDSVSVTIAQDTPLPLQQIAEYDLGFDCPVTSTLDPAGETLWVLTNTCGSRNFSLLAFDPDDGTPVEADADHFAEALTPLDDQWLYPETRPLAFTPDGALDILYSDAETYDTLSLRLTLDGDPAPDDTRTLPTFDTVNALIPGYEGYLETTVYNADHTLAAVPNIAALHIVDLPSGTELFSIDAAPDVFASIPSFSAAEQRLYVATFNNIDAVNDYSATLRVYSLPDGDLLETYDVPSALLWVSPNEQYAAGIFGDSQGESETLIVTELATGRTSAGIEMYEPSRQLTACVNDGRNMSDVDFTVSGKLPLRDLTWLPDSSGFLTVHSYGGEAAGGGSPCYFNYSRLRHYSVGGE